MSKTDEDRLERAAERAVKREQEAQTEPELSVVARLGQIGVLGWTVIVPTLLGLFVGRWLDQRFATGIFFSAALLIVGVVIGFWSAWKWMRRSEDRR